MDKVCSRCRESKPLASFRLRSPKTRKVYKSLVGQHQAYCKPCERQAYASGSNRRWVMLASNLRRHYQAQHLPAAKLRDELGDPVDCYLCGRLIDGWSAAELDHMIPFSFGGLTEINNLRWTHRRCNRMKHDLGLSDFLAHIEVILCHHSG